jgi:oligopeptide transport system substrate-binding protein
MTRRSWPVAALLGTFAVGAGCGRSPGPDGPTVRAARVEEAPRVLRYGNGAEPQDLDPQVVQGVPESHLMFALFEGLLNPDPRDLHPIPGLASSWEISPDGLVYTFHLRDNIRWSDGSPITTDDFLMSWKRMLSPRLAAEYAYLIFNYVKGAKAYNEGTSTDFSDVGFKATDGRTLQVTLNSPTPFLTKIIANHYAWDPLPMKVLLRFGALDQRSTQWTRSGNLVASGPFMLKEWVPQVRIVAVRNPAYWDSAHVRLDEVDFIPTEDIPAEERMFRSGQLDRTQEIPVDKIDAYRKEHREQLHIDPYLGVGFYRCNVARPPLNDKRVRRALALGIDRERLVRSVMRGGQLAAYAVSPPGDSGYTPRARIEGTLEDARRLLAEAGYPGGRGLPPIQFLYNTSSNNKQLAEAVQEMWRTNLGVDIELLNEEWKVYLDSQHSHNFQLERSGWIADYPDPHVFLEVFETGNGNNDTQWSNPEFDRLLHDALKARDEAERYEIYQRMDAILVDECPVIPIYYFTRPYLMSTRVKGYTPNLMDNPFFKTISMGD